MTGAARVVRRAAGALGLAWGLVACTGAPDDPAPADEGATSEAAPERASPAERASSAGPASPAEVSIPEVAWALPERTATTPVPAEATEEVVATRDLLAEVVSRYGLDPGNPWAIGHAVLVHGPDAELSNGEPATDWLFAEYAHEVEVGGETLVAFPREVGDVRVEPHTDLLLKALAEAGATPDRAVTVDGASHPLGDLYRYSLARTAVVDGEPTAQGWNDTPWTLRGLATWAPPELSWTARGGHPTTLDGFTHDVVSQLSEECAPIREAMEAGRDVQKRKQGIFGYTCGGAHLYQGAAYAVARGFGQPGDRATVQAQIPGLFHRLDVELAQVDAAIRQHPDYALILLEQRLKFLGHFLETTHQMAALGLFEPSADQQQAMQRALDQLVATVAVINQTRVLERLDEVRTSNEQVYLDFVGDAAHAVRGIDLATGEASVAY